MNPAQTLLIGFGSILILPAKSGPASLTADPLARRSSRNREARRLHRMQRTVIDPTAPRTLP